jgi:hypothetical protein
MTADTPGVWTIQDGNGNKPQANITLTAAIITPQFAPRTNGGPVEAGNPLPVYDQIAEAALGTPADSVPANAGATGSVVAFLRAIWAALLGVLKVGQADSYASTGFSVAIVNTIFNLPLVNARGVIGFQITGLSASGAVLTPLFSNDNGATWHPANGIAGGFQATLAVDGPFRMDAAGHTNVGFQVTTAGAGSVQINSNASAAAGIVAFASAQPVIPQPVSANGTDASGAPPALANILGSFTVTQPGAYFVQNQSAATLQVIFDNGSGGDVSVQLLAAGGNAGSQGADTTPPMPFYIGRVQIAGPAGSQYLARHN